MERAADDRRLALVEVLGYAGTAIALVGTGAVVGSLTGGGRGITIVVSFLVAVALFVAGWFAGGGRIESLRRMRSVLWFLAAGAAQGFFAAVIEPSGRAGSFIVFVLTAVVAAALWIVLRRSLQQLALYGAAAGAILILVVPDLGSAVGGVLLGGPPNLVLTAIVTVAIGAGWLALGARGLVAPPRTALVLGSLTMLVGTLLLTVDAEAWAFLAMAFVGVALLIIGDGRADRAVGGIGIVGLLLGAAAFFGDIVSGAAGSVIALVIGVAVLASALLLARSWGAVPAELPALGVPRGPQGSPGPPSPPPPPPPESSPPPSPPPERGS